MSSSKVLGSKKTHPLIFIFLNTQMLLGPLIEQISVEKPVDGNESIPSSQDMDQALVLCLGQMAITAGTDLLWKPLNHEVLF